MAWKCFYIKESSPEISAWEKKSQLKGDLRNHSYVHGMENADKKLFFFFPELSVMIRYQPENKREAFLYPQECLF